MAPTGHPLRTPPLPSSRPVSATKMALHLDFFGAAVACGAGAIALLLLMGLLCARRLSRPVRPAFPMSHEDAARVNLKVGFARRLVEGKSFDAIVVGSGMGGLTAGALLARAGKRVLVLEQHDVAGGCMHAFEEEGVEFDAGAPCSRR